MMQLTVVKIGGNIIDDEKQLASFLRSFAAIEGYKILVHGGGKIATEIGKKLGIEAKYINGRRITDAATLELVTMVYAGSINKKIVAVLQASGCNAIGLTGADANTIPADKRPVGEVDYGFVGDIKAGQVNAGILKTFLENGLMPVFAPLTHDGAGTILNTNADTIAQEIAKSMSGLMNVQLIYCFEKKGVLLDPANEDSVIDQIDEAGFEDLKTKGIISDGMIPKLENALAAIGKGVKKVVIGHAVDFDKLTTGAAGTSII